MCTVHAKVHYVCNNFMLLHRHRNQKCCTNLNLCECGGDGGGGDGGGGDGGGDGGGGMILRWSLL